MAIFRVIASIVLSLLVWQVLSWHLNGALLPSPGVTFHALIGIVSSAECWQDIGLTLMRGAVGLAISTGLALVLGIWSGVHQAMMEMLSPWIAILQSCPSIVWISILMVWLGIGNPVPILVVMASTFPVMFITISSGTRALSQRYLEVARLYRVPPKRVLTQLIFPGIQETGRAGFAFALGITWKVAATAEFFGVRNGIGARIQLALQKIELPQIFAWTFLLVGLGILLDQVQKKVKKG